jgi:hypothetical protein
LNGNGGLENISFVWPSPSGSCSEIGNDGNYSFVIKALSNENCDKNLLDNQGMANCYVSESGDPPEYEAYRIKRYYLVPGRELE